MNLSPATKKSPAFAVVVALIAVVVLTIMAGAFAYAMKVETRLSANANSDEQMIWLGRSGAELACYVLAQEPPQFDTKNEIWAGGSGFGAETNGPLMGMSLNDYPVGFPDPVGTVSLKMIDLESKININTAPPQLLQQVFTTMGIDANDISVLSDSIQDWVDADDGTRPAGAESDYYQGLTPPYFAKNGPIDDLSEMLLIKGVTRRMLDGSGGDPGNASPFQHQRMGLNNSASSQEANYEFYFTNVFTPFSSGKININTADANVLALIPGMDTASAENIVKYRAGPDGAEGTDDDTPFTSNGQLAAAGVNPQAIQQIGNYVAFRSTTFEVHITAKMGDRSREFVAVIFRNGPITQIVRFYWQ